ncbi:helix-turn-helix domain-containing protein [Bacteroides sp.]|uniref:helix-turn-helix transcriptional regulator n=1 Tax=Bacteroides sp. TaxID=29523 RepID=UPI003AB62350
MKLLQTCILCICTLLPAGPANLKSSVSADLPASAPLPDSLLTEDCVYRYTFSNFPLACRIMDRLHAQAQLPAHRLDITEGDLYFNNGYYHRALKYYHRALLSDSIRLSDDAYMDQLHRLISTYDCLHNDDKKAHYIDLLLRKADATHNRPMHSIALFNLGKMLYYQGNKSEGYQHMHQAIGEMQQTDYEYKFDNLRYNYNTLLVLQQRDRLYPEALRTLDDLGAIVTRQQQGAPSMEGLDNKELKALYANRAVVLQRLGREQEAEQYYRRFLALGSIHDRDNYLIVPYLSDRHLYDDIIRMNSAREAFLQQQGDTVTYHMVTIKRSLGEAYEARGDFRRAATYFRQLALLHDSIKNREQHSAALELAALYDTNEKEILLQQQSGELRERNIWLLSAAGLLLLLAAGLWRTIRYNRIIRRKNHTLMQSINEQMDYKMRWQESRQATEELHRQIEQLQAEATTTDNTEAVSIDREENICVFDRLETLLTEQPIYLDSNFTASDLVQLAGVNRNRLNTILMQYAHCTAAVYINRLRIEYAACLIREHPRYIISYIAEECGLPNTSTFHRLFRERYGMTPAEYKKQLKSSN